MHSIGSKFGLCFALIGLPTSQPAVSATVGPFYVFGTISQLTSTQDGVMIIIENAQTSQNCVNASAGWMLIDKSMPHMISAVLSSWFTGKRYVYVYTNATNGTYCAVTQVQVSG